MVRKPVTLGSKDGKYLLVINRLHQTKIHQNLSELESFLLLMKILLKKMTLRSNSNNSIAIIT